MLLRSFGVHKNTSSQKEKDMHSLAGYWSPTFEILKHSNQISIHETRQGSSSRWMPLLISESLE